MKHLLLAGALLPLTAFAQATWEVEVGGSTLGSPDPYYNPQHLAINAGDTVRWRNASGTHNVDGSTATFPGNPEAFYSGEGNFGNWTYDFKFTVPGVYSYHCTQDGHAATQFGTITVTGDTRVGEQDGGDGITLFPVPTKGTLVVELGTMKIGVAEVFSLDGQRVIEHPVQGAARVEIGTASLAAGQYFLRLVDMRGRAITRPFRRE